METAHIEVADMPSFFITKNRLIELGFVYVENMARQISRGNNYIKVYGKFFTTCSYAEYLMNS